MEEHSLSQRVLAETLGTALLVLVGPGSVVATLVLAGDKVPAIDGSDLLGISFAFGLVITALVYAIGKVSGCHINPAVTGPTTMMIATTTPPITMPAKSPGERESTIPRMANMRMPVPMNSAKIAAPQE